MFLLAKSKKKNENYTFLVLSLVWTQATFCLSSPMTPEEFTTIHVFDHMQSLAQHRMGQRLAVCCHSCIEKCGDVRPKALFHCRTLFTTADRMSRLEHYLVSRVHGILMHLCTPTSCFVCPLDSCPFIPFNQFW